MKCNECEQNGLKNIQTILAEDQKTIFHPLKKEIENIKRRCYKENGYFIIECETRQKLVPIKEKPITRYECSNKHSWFL